MWRRRAPLDEAQRRLLELRRSASAPRLSATSRAPGAPPPAAAAQPLVVRAMPGPPPGGRDPPPPPPPVPPPPPGSVPPSGREQSREARPRGYTSQTNCLVAGSRTRFDVSPSGALANMVEDGSGE